VTGAFIESKKFWKLRYMSGYAAGNNLQKPVVFYLNDDKIKP